MNFYQTYCVRIGKIYTHIYIYVHVHAYTCISTHIILKNIFEEVPESFYDFMKMIACVCVCAHMCVHVFVCMCAYMYVCACVL